jgi:microcystin-dependent protein
VPDVILPVAYATVSGLFLQALADSADDGDFVPDLMAMEGTVTFTPNVDRVSVIGADGQAMMVFPKPVECGLDADGWLVGPDGSRDVVLIATGFLIPSYRVLFGLEGVRNFTINITAPADQTTDLALALELPDNPAPDIAAWEAAATAALQAAVRAEEAARVAESGLRGPQGVAGSSAYQVWVNAGNSGTVSEFLLTLAGADGGDGAEGADGKSAYQVWLDAGNTGTVSDYLTSLVGADGDPGVSGKSAYELWLEAGNTGTVSDYQLALMGEVGDPGGDGKSAYEVWLDAGNTGTVSDYQLTLVGETGIDGAAMLPAGSVMTFAGDVAPANFAFCVGQEFSRTGDASLFAAIGTRYGVGDGTTTFNGPDYRGRSPIGLDATQPEFNTLGKTGGAKTHTLTVAEMPNHSHQARLGNVSPGDGSGYRYSNNDSGLGSVQIQATGGGGAHNNLQPYIAVNFIIKTSNGDTPGDSQLTDRVSVLEGDMDAFESVGSMPAGTIVEWPTATAPENWALCLGQTLSRTGFASLYAVIGTTYGVGDGSTTFNVPDFRGRAPVGANWQEGEFWPLGKTGGAKTHTLTSAQSGLPAHTHQLTGSNGGNGGASMAVTGNTNNDFQYGPMNGARAMANVAANAAASHNNLQPYIAIYFIIKTSNGDTPGDSQLTGRVGVLEANLRIPLSLNQIDTVSRTSGTAWTLGPVFPVVSGFRANSRIKLSSFIPMRNDDSNWGGGQTEFQVRFNGGTWQSLGSRGFGNGVMSYGPPMIGSETQIFIIDPVLASAFNAQFRTYFRSYSGTVQWNGGNQSINAISGTATLMSGDNGSLNYAHLVIEEILA